MYSFVADDASLLGESFSPFHAPSDPQKVQVLVFVGFELSEVWKIVQSELQRDLGDSCGIQNRRGWSVFQLEARSFVRADRVPAAELVSLVYDRRLAVTVGRVCCQHLQSVLMLGGDNERGVPLGRSLIRLLCGIFLVNFHKIY